MDSVITMPTEVNQAVAQTSTEFAQLVDAIDALHQAIMEQPKDRFLHLAMYHFHRILKADYVIAGRVSPNAPHTVQSAMVLFRGSIVPNIEYSLKGTPCDIVVNRKACCFPHDVANLFPDDEFLRTHAIEGYVGAPITNDSGQRVGLLVALSCHPIENPNHLLTMAELFAMSITPIIAAAK